MSDLKAYIRKRKKSDFEFRAGFDEGYKAFKIGVLRSSGLSRLPGTSRQQGLRLREHSDWRTSGWRRRPSR